MGWMGLGRLLPLALAAPTATTNATVYKYSWNIFRYMGDFLHLGGIVVLIMTIVKRQSVAGLSQKTQLLYTIVYTTRYLDLLSHSQAAYLVIFKLIFIFSALVTLSAFQRFGETWEKTKDTCKITIFLIPCFVLALVMTAEFSLLEILWTFSEFLEAVAMVPQYIFSYRDMNCREVGVNGFIVLIGAYRVMYSFNWMYKKYQVPQYSDIDSWIAGIIEIGLFADYMAYRFAGISYLRKSVLFADLKVHEMHEKVERKLLGGEAASFETTDTGELRRRKKVNEQEGQSVGF